MNRQPIVRRKQRRNAALEDKLAARAEAFFTPHEEAEYLLEVLKKRSTGSKGINTQEISNWISRHAAKITAKATAEPLHTSMKGFSPNKFYVDYETAPLQPRVGKTRGVAASHVWTDESSAFFATEFGEEFINGSILDSAVSSYKNHLELRRAKPGSLRRATGLASTFAEVLTRQVLGDCISVSVPTTADFSPVYFG